MYTVYCVRLWLWLSLGLGLVCFGKLHAAIFCYIKHFLTMSGQKTFHFRAMMLQYKARLFLFIGLRIRRP